MYPFILFSLPRTGSTTLLRVMNCHPGINCVFEPFSPANPAKFANQCNLLRQTRGLPVAVRWLWGICNGFKHVWEADGWPFADERDLNRQLLTEMGACIVLVHRRNALRRAISMQISDQMQLWIVNTDEDKQRIQQHTFMPLDIGLLRAEIAASKEQERWARDLLETGRMPWVDAAYEDYLDAGLGIEAKIEAVQKLLEFLEVGRLTDPEKLEKMCELFDPAATGFQNERAYAQIPNIHEVEDALGSNENGYVFEDAW